MFSGKYESPLVGTGGGDDDIAGEPKPLRDERRDIPSEGVQYGVSVGEGEAQVAMEDSVSSAIAACRARSREMTRRAKLM